MAEARREMMAAISKGARVSRMGVEVRDFSCHRRARIRAATSIRILNTLSAGGMGPLGLPAVTRSEPRQLAAAVVAVFIVRLGILETRGGERWKGQSVDERGKKKKLGSYVHVYMD